MVFTATAKYFHSAWFRAFAGKVAAAAMFLVPPLLIQAQDLPGQDDYSLAAGDSVLVRVYGEDDLTMELDVPAGGRVDYAFVGEFELSGKSVRAVQREIHERLLGDRSRATAVSMFTARSPVPAATPGSPA
jgi:protein involved in polysaccharide export with SLBB domain